MGAIIFLILEGLGWLLYGLYCFADPSALSASAGVTYVSPTGSTELRAMYGGLQAAVGLLALGGVLRTDLRRSALLTIAFLTGGLFTARFLGLLIDGGVSGYTLAGLLFESASAALAVWLLRRGTMAA